MKCNMISLVVALILSISSRLALADDVKSKTLLIDGKEIPYLTAGDGPLLILLHGALSDHRAWKDHIATLSDSFEVVAIPQRFYANGAWEDTDTGQSYFSNAADDIAAFIRTLGRGPAHLVGWSMGAFTAHMTALEHPDQVRSAYLFEGGIPLAPESPEDIARSEAETGPVFDTMIDMARKGDHAGLARFIWEEIAAEAPYEPLPLAQKEAFESFAASYAKVLLFKPFQPVPCTRTKESSVPMVLIMGDSTSKVMKRYLNERWLDCVRVTVVHGANHLWPRAGMADFIESVTTFANAY